MAIRKVLNLYVPPDFDPSLLPRIKRDRTKLIEVRMMLPFSLQCKTCGEYQYRGKKYNSKMEIAKGEDYLGIRRYRFYIKCCVCSAEITFKTDPKNSDYELESGAIRTYEVWKDNQETIDNAEKERMEEDTMDAMKALENRTLESKHEIDLMDALDEIKAINQRHERVDTGVVLSSLKKTSQDTSSEILTADDELAVEEFRRKRIRGFEQMETVSSSNTEDSIVEENNIDSKKASVGIWDPKISFSDLTDNDPVDGSTVLVVRKKKKLEKVRNEESSSLLSLQDKKLTSKEEEKLTSTQESEPVESKEAINVSSIQSLLDYPDSD